MWKGISDMLIQGHLMSVQISLNTWMTMEGTGKKLFLVGLVFLKSGKKIEKCPKIIGVHGT